MNKEFEQILMGSMCGDGHIGIGKRCITPKYSEGHSIAQKEYLSWKMNYFYDYRPKFYEYKTWCSFITKSSDDFSSFHNLFYTNGKYKMLSEESIFSLRPLGLSVWYQDDGNYNYRLNTCNIVSNVYSKDVNSLIVRYLDEMYKIKSSVYKSGIVNGRQRYYLSIYKNSTDDFLNIIKEFVHPSMTYKLGHLCDSNHSKLEEGKIDRKATRKLWNITCNAKRKQYWADNKDFINSIRNIIRWDERRAINECL